MPNWEPNWNNVQWDHGTANAAAWALRAAADQLESLLGRRLQAARLAQIDFEGPHRIRFDAYLEETKQRSNHLASELREAASRIQHASDRAAAEQRYREDQRQRWWDEKRREERSRWA